MDTEFGKSEGQYMACLFPRNVMDADGDGEGTSIFVKEKLGRRSCKRHSVIQVNGCCHHLQTPYQQGSAIDRLIALIAMTPTREGFNREHSMHNDWVAGTSEAYL